MHKSHLINLIYLERNLNDVRVLAIHPSRLRYVTLLINRNKRESKGKMYIDIEASQGLIREPQQTTHVVCQMALDA